ncbi:MAG: FeoB-associated Cys-rich membrane protein [Rikenellaceae bacterium]|nr:FeoB-associated Cys-rich membrane protein [Rikenellaceae bacterium]
MTWQDWTVAAIGIALAVWLIWRLVRRLQGKSKSSCYGCACADSCPSARKEQDCSDKKRK